ncbi:MAG: SRPBCC domain-containing protein [Xanthobacteraceae bacterium]
MPYTYTLSSIIPATPRQVYEAWLDSVAHSEMTGSDAEMSDQVGAEVSAWDGYITGSNLELVPGERIVQSWRTSEFDDEHSDSIVAVTLEPIDEGTLLTLVHSNVPDEQRSHEEGGWESRYFEPMKAYFAKLEQEEGDEETEETEETEPESAAPVRSEVPAERPATRSVKEPAPPAKPSAAKKKKTKPTVSVKARRKTVKPKSNKAKRALPRKKAKAKSNSTAKFKTKSKTRSKTTSKTKSQTKSKRRSKARKRARR